MIVWPVRRFAAVFILGLPGFAFAELSNDSMIGPGLRSRPAYDGSGSQRTEFVPVIRHLGEHWFVRSTQGVLEGGGRVEIIPGLHAGAQLAYEPGRLSSESGFLRANGVPDIKRGASLGLQLEWDHMFGPMPVTFLGRIRKNIDAGLGTQSDLRVSAGVLKAGPVAAGVFTQATWADSKAMNVRYGVAGPSPYQAGGGMMAVSAGLLASAELGASWRLVGSLEARRLRGNAAHSPLVEQKSSHYITAGAAYRF